MNELVPAFFFAISSFDNFNIYIFTTVGNSVVFCRALFFLFILAGACTAHMKRENTEEFFYRVPSPLPQSSIDCV